MLRFNRTPFEIWNLSFNLMFIACINLDWHMSSCHSTILASSTWTMRCLVVLNKIDPKNTDSFIFYQLKSSKAFWNKSLPCVNYLLFFHCCCLNSKNELILKYTEGKPLVRGQQVTALSCLSMSLSGVQGWRRDESTRLPPMWHGFDCQTPCHMRVEFVGSLLCSALLCSERFFSGYSSFSLSSKTNIWLDLH